jgi:hypothetical protein
MIAQPHFFSFTDEPAVAGEKQWLWHGMLMPGKLTLLTALWKSGKTTLLAHLLARRRHGGEFLGLNVAAGRSVVVSEEPRDLWPMRQAQHRFGPELAIVPRPFAGRPTLAELEELSARLVEMKEQSGLDLVVFDSLSVFLPSRNENSAGSVTNAMSPFIALAEAGLSVLLLHHPSKGEPALGQAARGSGAITASVDIVLEMRHPGGNPFTQRRKIFGWSRHDETPRQMLIELSPDGRDYSRLPDTTDDFHENWETVLQVLANSPTPMTRQEIRAGWPPEQARPHDSTLWRWLDKAMQLGLAVRAGKGSKGEPHRYGVAG